MLVAYGSDIETRRRWVAARRRARPAPSTTSPPTTSRETCGWSTRCAPRWRSSRRPAPPTALCRAASIVVVSDGLNYKMDSQPSARSARPRRKEPVPIHTIAFSPQDDRGPLLNLGELSKRSNGTFRWAQKRRTISRADRHARRRAEQAVRPHLQDSKSRRSTARPSSLCRATCVERRLRSAWARSPARPARPAAGGGSHIAGGSRRHRPGARHARGASASSTPTEPSPAAGEPQQPQQQQQAARRRSAPAQPRRRLNAPAASSIAASATRHVHRLGGALSGNARSIASAQAPIHVGKGPATLQITDDPTVSTRHARSRGEPHGFVVTDLVPPTAPS